MRLCKAISAADLYLKLGVDEDEETGHLLLQAVRITHFSPANLNH